MKACRRKKFIQSIPEISSPGSFLRPAFSKAAEDKHLFPIAVHAVMEIAVDVLGKGKKKRKQSTMPMANLCLDFSKERHSFFVRRSRQVELEYFGAVLWAKLPSTGKCSTCIQQNEKYTGIYARKHRVSRNKY